MTGLIVETSALLERTPGVLRALLAGLPGSWTDTPDLPGGWRPRDVVAHLAELRALAAEDDLDHVGQMSAGLAGSDYGDVGAWKAYLGILLRRDDPSSVAG